MVEDFLEEVSGLVFWGCQGEVGVAVEDGVHNVFLNDFLFGGVGEVRPVAAVVFVHVLGDLGLDRGEVRVDRDAGDHVDIVVGLED